MNVTAIKAAQKPEDLHARARALVPILRARSQEIAETRRVPDDIIARLYAEGLMELARPKLYGGPDLGVDLIFDIAQILAEGDGSVAWVYGVTNSHDHLVGLYPKEVQDAYWASGRPLCASSYVPTGRAEKVEGGYKLNGQWPFCSGIDHCDWVVVGGVTGMLPGEPPRPDLYLFMVRVSDLELVDDWDVMGLAGTGSKSVLAKDLFVPESYALSNAAVMTGGAPGAQIHDNPIYQASIWLMFGFSILSPATGILRGAYETMLADARQRFAAREPMFMAKLAQTEMRFAEVSALLEASEMLFNTAMRESYRLIANGTPFSDEIRVRNRRNQVVVARNCRQAMDSLMQMAGGRGIREAGAVQRAMRDLYAISAHPGGNWDGAMTSYGSVVLGGQPTEMFC